MRSSVPPTHQRNLLRPTLVRCPGRRTLDLSLGAVSPRVFGAAQDNGDTRASEQADWLTKFKERAIKDYFFN